jgi:hypothetical protein
MAHGESKARAAPRVAHNLRAGEAVRARSSADRAYGTTWIAPVMLPWISQT